MREVYDLVEVRQQRLWRWSTALWRLDTAVREKVYGPVELDTAVREVYDPVELDIAVREKVYGPVELNTGEGGLRPCGG